MLEYLAHTWATQPPLLYLLLPVLTGLLGFVLGLFGYTRAALDAYRRLVAAQQRVGGRPPHTWPERAP